MPDSSLSKKDQAAVAKRRIDRRYDLLLKLGSLLIARGLKWGFFGYLAYQGRLALAAFAGHTTFASLLLALGANASISITLSWTATAAFAIWVFLERRLRKGTTERLTLRNRELELRIDRGRTSSELTTRGDTRPEDQT
jgi:hypothetical protein